MATSQKLDISSDVFNNIAEKYSAGFGGANEQIVRALLRHAPSVTSESIIHDNACGPAVITRSILENCSDGQVPKIFATDYAQGMIDISNTLKIQNGWDNVSIERMDGQNLSFEDNKFSHSLSSLGVFMFPDEEKGLSEMYRTLISGGWAGVTSWKDIRWPTAALESYKRLFPDAEEQMSLPRTEGWDTPESCVGKLRNIGFTKVEAEVVEVIMRHPSREVAIEYFTGFLKNISPTVKAWDEETWKRFCIIFAEVMRPMYDDATDNKGVELKTQVVITYGTKG